MKRVANPPTISFYSVSLPFHKTILSGHVLFILTLNFVYGSLKHHKKVHMNSISYIKY